MSLRQLLNLTYALATEHKTPDDQRAFDRMLAGLSEAEPTRARAAQQDLMSAMKLGRGGAR